MNIIPNLLLSVSAEGFHQLSLWIETRRLREYVVRFRESSVESEESEFRKHYAVQRGVNSIRVRLIQSFPRSQRNFPLN